MEKLLSIIVPVYKVEAYLPECLDSFLPECDERVEVILVDDGSPDGCPAICDDYAVRYPYVRVIHQQNGGLAAARNAGLAQACGRYVGFIDSDDRFSKGAIPKILERLSGPAFDVCFMQTVRFYPDGTREDLGDAINHAGVAGKDKLAVMRYLASRPKYPGAAWSKIYRSHFLKEKHISFPVDRRLSEDLGFVRDAILAANVYESLDFPYYEYRQNRAGSITDTVSENRLQGLSQFITESIDLLTTDKKPNDEMAKCAMSFVAYEYAVLLMLCHDRLDKKSAWLSFMRQYRWVLSFGKHKKTKAVFAVSLGGIRFASAVMKWVKK